MSGRNHVKKPSSRQSRGRENGIDAIFPAPPPRSGLPREYASTLAEIKRRIGDERLRVVLSANSAMVLLYWDIGLMILKRQGSAGWGARVIDRLSADLQADFPGLKGFSPRNLKYMRAFSAAWPDRAIVQEALARIPWSHNIALLEKLTKSEERRWYASKVLEQGWSHNILVMQIENEARKRQGKAVTNFPATLPPGDSDLAAQVFKDPYLFDFLGTADPRRERDVEQALVEHVQKFLLELGTGFAFVGRQVLLEVGDQDYFVDLLFYHLRLRCFVVIELKAVAFDPAFVGQLNLYLSAADDLLRHANDKSTIGLLLCRSKNQVVVEYALRDMSKPIGVAGWGTKLVNALPAVLKGNLPTVEELEAELADGVPGTKRKKRTRRGGRDGG